jgi:hypothetical protein
MKLCKDCRYFDFEKRTGHIWPFRSSYLEDVLMNENATCLRTKKEKIDPVTGRETYSIYRCRTERKESAPEACGANAQYFEPRVPED